MSATNGTAKTQYLMSLNSACLCAAENRLLLSYT